MIDWCESILRRIEMLMRMKMKMIEIIAMQIESIEINSIEMLAK
jgi:hypothetical protein